MATLPAPIPGLVIRYVYLWSREYRQGRDEGQKDRPCAIVAALRPQAGGATRVLVLPITHRAPENPDLAMEIPAVTMARLGLDGERSWVMLSEWNEFAWPGPDLRRLPGGSVVHGMLPPAQFAVLRERFLSLAKSMASRRVPRT